MRNGCGLCRLLATPGAIAGIRVAAAACAAKVVDSARKANWEGAKVKDIVSHLRVGPDAWEVGHAGPPGAQERPREGEQRLSALALQPEGRDDLLDGVRLCGQERRGVREALEEAEEDRVELPPRRLVQEDAADQQLPPVSPEELLDQPKGRPSVDISDPAWWPRTPTPTCGCNGLLPPGSLQLVEARDGVGGVHARPERLDHLAERAALELQRLVPPHQVPPGWGLGPRFDSCSHLPACRVQRGFPAVPGEVVPLAVVRELLRLPGRREGVQVAALGAQVARGLCAAPAGVQPSTAASGLLRAGRIGDEQLHALLNAAA
mmetsp:Transcript_13237/g.33396  ORF Transcript_13237/g.33396 Transcript_13237/m.33396 type:complete len:320 (+) Transcript_13237:93-1052(+)